MLDVTCEAINCEHNKDNKSEPDRVQFKGRVLSLMASYFIDRDTDNYDERIKPKVQIYSIHINIEIWNCG